MRWASNYHKSIGLPLEDRLLKVLDRAGWNHRNAPVFIQSFEQANLIELSKKTSVKLIQLIDASDVALDGTLLYAKPSDRPYDWTVSGRKDLYSYLVTPRGLAEVKTSADGIGPWKRYIVSVAGVDKNGDGIADDINGDGVVNDADKTTLPPSKIVEHAHRLGLLVHPYTFRNEPRYLASNYIAAPINEYIQFYQLGVDGLFSDFADTAVAARVMFKLLQDPEYDQCLVRGDCDNR